jgi:linker histone H1 and H5 family
LTLLPHSQLVELCLAFEAYSPLHVKNSLWPTDLAAAVAELQSPAAQQQKDVISGPVANATHPETGSRPSDNTDEPSVSQETQPVPSTSSAAPAATVSSQGPYPHTSYGYPSTQSPQAYPHSPYYPPLSYPPHPSAPYPLAGFPPMHTPFPPTHSSNPPFPIPHNGVLAEDLPSYEDMLVEALTELAESDGSAPKSLFTWMASRYPLHTNFRPSASQALQKAFKRGRLEKGSNGKYRLNASWDGGSVGSITLTLGSDSKLAHDFFFLFLFHRHLGGQHVDLRPLGTPHFRRLVVIPLRRPSHTPRFPTLPVMVCLASHQRLLLTQHKANPHHITLTRISTRPPPRIPDMHDLRHLMYQRASPLPSNSLLRLYPASQPRQLQGRTIQPMMTSERAAMLGKLRRRSSRLSILARLCR